MKTRKFTNCMRMLLVAAFFVLLKTASYGQLLFNENFNYADATLLSANGWTAHSGGGTNAITVHSASPISYTDYPTGNGNYVSMTTSGEDDNKTYTSQTTGTIYAAFLVKISAAQTGDYFFHLGPSPIGATFVGRVYAKVNAGTVQFGIAKYTGAANYNATTYALNTTHLIVVKYSIVAGATNDVASIIIDPVINSTEPIAGWTTCTDGALVDPANIGAVALRQGTAGSMPTIAGLDGIRIAKTWDEAIGFAWEGTTSTDWNVGTNWSDGAVPNSSNNVFILPQTNQPHVTLATGTPALCKALVIDNTATLTIDAGKALTASGNTTLNGPACLVIQSEGSFIDNGISGAGTARVEKSLDQSRWYYIGLPVSTIVAASSYGTISTVLNTDTHLWYWDESLQAYQQIANGTDNLDPSSPVLRGYSVKDYSNPISAVFTGTLNSGPITNANLTYNATGSFQGYNLVCNPYPSAINLGTWNGTDATTTSLIPVSNLETSVWYRTGGNFGVYNWTSGGTGTNGAQQYVPAMQAFWVRAKTSTTGSLAFNNGARQHNSQAFYKTTSGNNVFRMNVSDGTNTDETVVGFYQDAQDVFENFDSEKMMAVDDIPQLYSLTSDNTEVAINGQPELTTSEERVIPLGFATNVAGTFTLNATNLTDFDPSVSVYLEDVQQNSIQYLNQNATYTFTSGIVNTASRFKLHFGNNLTSISTESKNNISLYGAENSIYLSISNEANVEVYSLLGEKISSTHAVKGLNKITLNTAKGVYIVKVQTGSDIITEKVLIGN